MGVPDLDIDDIVIECLNDDNGGTFKKLKKAEKEIWSKEKEVVLNVGLMYDRIEIMDPELFEDLIKRYDVTEEEIYGINYEFNNKEKNKFQKKISTSRVVLFSQQNKKSNNIKYQLAIYDEKKDKFYEIQGFKKSNIERNTINIDGITHNVLAQYNDNQLNKKYAIYRDDYDKELKIAQIEKSNRKNIKQIGINLCTKNQWAFGLPEEMKNEIIKIEEKIREEINILKVKTIEYNQQKQIWKVKNNIKSNTWNQTEQIDYSKLNILEKISIEDEDFLKEISKKYKVELNGMYPYKKDKKVPSRIHLISVANEELEKLEYNLVIEDDDFNMYKILEIIEDEPTYIKKIYIENNLMYIKEAHILKEFSDNFNKSYIAYRDCNGKLGFAKIENNLNQEYKDLSICKFNRKLNDYQKQLYINLIVKEKNKFDYIDKPIWLVVTENILNLFRGLVGKPNKVLALPAPKVDVNGWEAKKEGLQLYKNKELKAFVKVIKNIFNKNNEYEKEF